MAITTPTTIWYGDNDIHVPPFLTKRLINKMPNAKVKIIKDKGHFMIFRLMPDIIDSLEIIGNKAP